MLVLVTNYPPREKHFSPVEWNYMTIESLYLFINVNGKKGRGGDYSPQSPCSTIHVMMMMMLMGLSE